MNRKSETNEEILCQEAAQSLIALRDELTCTAQKLRDVLFDVDAEQRRLVERAVSELLNDLKY